MKAQYKPTFDSEWIDWPYWNGPTEAECSAVEAGAPLFWMPDIGADAVRLMAFRWADGREWMSGDDAENEAQKPASSGQTWETDYMGGLRDLVNQRFQPSIINEAATADLEEYAKNHPIKEYGYKLTKGGKWRWIGWDPSKEQCEAAASVRAAEMADAAAEREEEEKVPWLDDRRIGRIRVSDCFSSEELAKAFGLIGFVPYHWDPCLNGELEFSGISPKFAQQGRGEMLPQYSLTVSRDTETGCDVAMMERVTPNG